MGIEARRNPPAGAVKPEPPSAPPIKNAAELAIDLLANFEQNKLSCQVLFEMASNDSLPSGIYKIQLNERIESWVRAIGELRIVARKHGVTLPIQATR